MARDGYVPDELKWGSFTVAEARALGVSRRQLQGGAWRRVFHGRYRWVGTEGGEDLTLRAIASGMPAGFAFAGVTAARLLGMDLPPGRRPEVIVPPSAVVSTRAQAGVRRVHLDPDDVVWRAGLPLTSPLRTCFDLAGRLPIVEGVVALDLALHDGLVPEDALRGYITGHAGTQGVVRARRAIELADARSESPMETRLRLLLVRNGLPCPQAQVSIHDAGGAFLGRLDLYYAQANLGIEYDGENHRDRLASDDQRQNRLLRAGIRLLRYTAIDLKSRPNAIVAEVRSQLCT
ncbi:MAG: DUF559 domain-containing protein [Candidatus Dormibacteraeota bacterium]|nr:DUF559 domain-containing protein [Candidatus Dormibacteraeota bacterium]